MDQNHSVNNNKLKHQTKKRKCVFNDELKAKFPFMKRYSEDDDSTLTCTYCNSSFSIANGGITDIQKHIGREKHKNNLSKVAGHKQITKFYRKAEFETTERKLAAAEGTWVYHSIQHNYSFRSNDCTSKIIQQMFDNKYACARTKSESIVCQVFAPFSEEQLLDHLKNVSFITLCCDASNHKHIKLMPILVRYFLPESGCDLKILELKNVPGETSELISTYINETTTNLGLADKVIGFCADNTNSNFGGSGRGGTNNVFYKMKTNLKNQNIVGIGCYAHIINNCIKTSCDILPIDVEAFLVKIYSHFYIYTVRVEKLKEFCEFVNIEYKNVLGYSNTRWLALLPSLERILQIYKGLKSYFLSIDKCPTLIKQYFNNPVTEFWLFFVHNIAAFFHKAILVLEKEKISVIEATKVYDDVIIKLEARLDNMFIPFTLQNLLSTLVDETAVNRHQIDTEIFQFYTTATMYLKQWRNPHSDTFQKFDWVLLNKVPEYPEIQLCLEFINYKKTFVNENDLFDEVIILKNYVSDEKILSWKSNSVSIDARWVEIFQFFKENDHPFVNLLYFVEYILCLPGTNAQVERVFSHINNYWTSDKTQLKVETLKAVLLTKINLKYSCNEFYTLLLTNYKLCKSVHSVKKYTFKA